MMSPTKILYVIDKCGIGGATTHLLSAVGAMDRARFAPTVCCLLSGAAREEEFRVLGVPMRHLGVRKIYGWRALRGWFRLIRWIRRERFDIVHTYLFSANVFGVLAAWMAGVPVIISSRREVVDWMRPHHRWACRVVNRFCNAITVNSQAIARSVVSHERVEPRKLVMIYNGVDPQRFRPGQDGEGRLKAALGPNGGPVILTVGHLSVIKGQADLLGAASYIIKTHPNVTVLLAGDGPMRGLLVAQAARLGIAKHVRFLGKQQNVPELLAVADIAVVPSRSEGCSNALLEAMACGKAVVATNVGGNPEAICHGTNGVLVPPENPQAMAEAIAALLDDPARRDRLGRAARETILERFTEQRMVDQMQQLYERLTSVRPHIRTSARPHIGTLGIIVSQFPETHETFVLRELRALHEAGIPLRIYSLKRCRDRIVHAEAHPLLAQTTYCSAADPRIWLTALRMFGAHPVRGLTALGWTLRHHAWPPTTLAKALLVWILSLAITRRVQEDRVTHLHAHWATMPTTAALIVSKTLGLPFSFTAHAWDLFVRNPSLKEKVKGATAVFTCTEYNRRYLSHFCPEEKGKIVLSYHGVDVEEFTSSRVHESNSVNSPNSSNSHTHTPSPLFLSVGRLVETKGFSTLIEAYRLLRNRGTAFKAVIVGEGPLRRALARQIRSSHLSGLVELRPTMPQGELCERYAQAFAFVSPCVVAHNGDRDGLPNVLLEAQACGLPVISTSVSGIPEAVQDARNGLLVAPEDPVALADAIERLLRKPAWARLLGDHGRLWVETQFDAREHMRQLVDHMQGLLTGSLPTRQPIKIMSIIWSLEIGGAERVVASLAMHGDRRRYQPMVVCIHRPGRLAESLRGGGIPVVSVGKRTGLDLSVVLRLVALMRRERPDIVHTHLWTANLWGRLAAWIAGVPVVVASEHNVDVWKRRRHVWLDRLLLRITDRVVCVSDGVRDFYRQQLPGANGKLVRIYNGIDHRTFAAPPRTAAAAHAGEWAGRFPVIAVIGRLVPAKGHRYCIEAVAQLAPMYPKLRVLFIGDGPLADELKRVVAQAGLSAVIQLTGLRRDIPEILQQIHLLVLPSLREGLPMVALEAMAAGVPVIASDVGGNREAVVDGQTGLIVPPKNAAALAVAIRRLLDERPFYEHASRAARRRVEEAFSVEQMIRETETLYHDLLEAAGRSQ